MNNNRKLSILLIIGIEQIFVLSFLSNKAESLRKSKYLSFLSKLDFLYHLKDSIFGESFYGSLLRYDLTSVKPS